MVNFKRIITIDSEKRSGKATIRGMRISVSYILGWLAIGMSIAEIIEDYDELTEDDIYAALSYAANKESRIFHTAV